MSTIFPLSASVGQTFGEYSFDGTRWNLIGIDLTMEYPQIYDGKIGIDVIPDSIARVDYVDTHIGESLEPYMTSENIHSEFLTQQDASEIYLTQVSASTTYLDQASASTIYVEKILADSTYLSQVSASLNYATIDYVDTGISNIDALPLQTGNSGKFLTTDGSAASWENVDALPLQTGNSGKFLTTTGSLAYWDNVDALPSQFGNSGKYLTTNGASASWSTVDLSNYLTSTINDNVSITDVTESNSSTTGALVVSGGVGIGKNLWIEGDLHVAGTTYSIVTQTVATEDNIIYLNSAHDSTITNAVYSSGSITYTADNDYVPGMDIRITGVNPSGFNISTADLLTVASATPTQFIVLKSDPGATYISGGTAHAKNEVNADLGFAGGYYSGSYAHAGLFRDASDGSFKFFQGYTPEPDEAVNIDTAHPSFSLAPIRASSAYFSGNIVSHVDISNPTFLSNTYTLSESDNGKLLLLDNSSTAGTLLVPTDETYNFLIGTQITIVQKGTGQISVSAVTPATTTINYTPGNKFRTQWSSASLIKIGANSWLLMGDLEI